MNPKTPSFPTLEDCVHARRVLRALEDKEDESGYQRMYRSSSFYTDLLDKKIESIGYKKFEGKFYKLSDFNLLSPLEI